MLKILLETKQKRMHLGSYIDEDVVMDIREFARKQGYSEKIMSLLHIVIKLIDQNRTKLLQAGCTF